MWISVSVLSAENSSRQFLVLIFSRAYFYTVQSAIGRHHYVMYVLCIMHYVCATPLSVRHVPERLCGGLVYLGCYNN